jgi:PAS domain S-box-containing protein
MEDCVDGGSADSPSSSRQEPLKPLTVPSRDFLLQQMAVAIEEVFWISPPDLVTLLFASPAFERVWGLPWDQAPQPPAAIIGAAHPEDFSRAFKEIGSVQHTPRDIEYRIIRPDGSIRWIRNRARGIYDEAGRLMMRMGAAADITERKLFQKSLIESHARFVTVLDSIEADIYVADMSTHEILFVNRHIQESYGPDLRGKRCWEVFHKEAGPCPRCISPDLVNPEGQPGAGVAWESLSPVNGKWYFNCGRAIKWVDGRLVRLQIATDISRLKKLETETSRIQTRLQQAQKMEAIGTLAGGIAHDFNNILTAILGYTEMAMMGVEETSAVNRNLQQVFKAGSRARELVKQILTFSRQTEHEFKPVQLDLIVTEALNLMRASLPATISIQMQLNSRSFTLADPTQVHQVIINLCTNAAHAMREKGGELFVGLEDLHPDPSFHNEHPELSPGAYQKLTVRDSGHGIPPDMQACIFEPFFTTKKRGEGTGMGLAVVSGIVKSHKGTIRVESAVGEGTTFQVFLPILQSPGAEPFRDPVPDLPSGHERILLVDDEEPIARLGQQMLEHLGYRVTSCLTAAEAFNIFIQNPWRFDLVVTDMTMPEMTGAELAEKILSIRRDIPVILCTGYSGKMSRKRAGEIGIRELIMKPMAIGELAQAVRKALDHAGCHSA